MSEPSFQAKEVSIGDLLRTSKPRVPALQRNYSWGNNEWRDLWDDLSDFSDISDDERQLGCRNLEYRLVLNLKIDILDLTRRRSAERQFIFAGAGMPRPLPRRWRLRRAPSRARLLRDRRVLRPSTARAFPF